MSVAINEFPIHKIENPSQFYVDFTINRLLNAEELSLYNKINNSFASCFASAKQQEPELASQHLHQGNLLLSEANHTIRTWVSVFCMPYISYYYYKIRDYEMAVRESAEIMSKVSVLEQTNHEYLFFCRIQQEQNLGRILWAQHDTTGLLRYMQNAYWKYRRNQVAGSW